MVQTDLNTGTGTQSLLESWDLLKYFRPELKASMQFSRLSESEVRFGS